MSTKPTRPRDEDDEPPEPYGVAFEAPHAPPPLSYPPEDDGELLPPEEASRPKKKRKRRPDGFGEVAATPRDQGPSAKPEPAGVPWWTASAVVAGVGALPTLLAVALIAANVKQGHFVVGVFLGLVVIGAAVVQTAAVTGFLYAFGNFFGIDYGPLKEAIVKLGATVVLVNGVTLFAWSLCVPLGPVAGVLAGVPALRRLFKLGVQESLLSVALIALPACVLTASIFALLATRP